MATTLTLTNGTTTIQLNNGSPWSIESDGIGFLWKPAINPWLPNDLAGGGDYGPATEEIPIVGNASTHVSIRQSLHTLATRLTEINAAYESGAEPWRIQWTPEGSAAVFESIIIDASMNVIEHPVTATGGALTRVIVRITRRSVWLEDDIPATFEASKSALTVPSAMGEITSLNWTAMGDENTVLQPSYYYWLVSTSPITYTYPIVTGIARSPEVQAGSGLTVASLLRYDARQMTATGPWSRAVLATRPLGASSEVLRYTPSGTTETFTNSLTATMPSNGYSRTGRVLVMATVRANQLTAGFTFRVQIENRFGIARTAAAVYTPTVTTPVTLILGIATIQTQTTNYTERQGVASIRLGIAASTTSGSPTIDIDQIYLWDIGDIATRVTVISSSNGIPTSPGYNAIGARSADVYNEAQHWVGLVDLGGFTAPGTPIYNIPYYGNPNIVTIGNGAVSAFIATTGTYWTAYDGSTTYAFSVYGVRRRAYLVVE